MDTYRYHRFYPRIVRAVDAILANGKVVTPIDVIVRMGLLDPKHLEDWRRGRVSYLERVINCNLPRLSRLPRILRFHAHDLKLQPSSTAYMRLGRGPKQQLQFTKSDDQNLEKGMRNACVVAGQKGPYPNSRARRERPHKAASSN